MKMKKLFLLFVLAGAMPLSMMAQDDDLYFTPSKKAAKTSSSVENKPAYYVGSNRDVDEYNRRGKFRSTYQKIGVDSLGNDIIEFQAGTGIYPDSTYVDTMWVSPKQKYQDDEDYAYSRRMSRWDGYYGWYDPWFYGHWGYRPWGYWGWYDPWYYSYYGWYDPWYYGYYGYPWYYGWGPYDPWYYGYYGYGWGGYSGGTYYGTGVSGTRNHGLQAVRLAVRARAVSALATLAARLRRTMASEFRVATAPIAIRMETLVDPVLPTLRPTAALRLATALQRSRQAAAIAVAAVVVVPSAALALVAVAAVVRAPVAAASVADVNSLFVIKWQSNEVA